MPQWCDQDTIVLTIFVFPTPLGGNAAKAFGAAFSKASVVKHAWSQRPSRVLVLPAEFQRSQLLAKSKRVGEGMGGTGGVPFRLRYSTFDLGTTLVTEHKV